MPLDKLLVTLGGLGAIAFIVWFFWLWRKEGVQAVLTSSGYQEALILVKGGYTPDVIVVEHGRPVRLNFRREETAACSEMVIFSDFNKSAKLPTGETVSIELMPEKPGAYEFACQMGMFRGRLIVE
jgi:plastocyanin domain-containing protein